MAMSCEIQTFWDSCAVREFIRREDKADIVHPFACCAGPIFAYDRMRFERSVYLRYEVIELFPEHVVFPAVLNRDGEPFADNKRRDTEMPQAGVHVVEIWQPSDVPALVHFVFNAAVCSMDQPFIAIAARAEAA